MITVKKTNLDGKIVPKTIYYHSKSDSMGRSSFTLEWPCTPYYAGLPHDLILITKRAQCFFSDPMSHGFPRPEDVKNSKIV